MRIRNATEQAKRSADARMRFEIDGKRISLYGSRNYAHGFIMEQTEADRFCDWLHDFCGFSVEVIWDGGLLSGDVLADDGYGRRLVLREVALNEWSSAYVIETVPKRIETYLKTCGYVELTVHANAG